MAVRNHNTIVIGSIGASVLVAGAFKAVQNNVGRVAKAPKQKPAEAIWNNYASSARRSF